MMKTEELEKRYEGFYPTLSMREYKNLIALFGIQESMRIEIIWYLLKKGFVYMA